MKRHKHSLSHYKLLTGDMGQLIPIGLLEAMPGDTIQHSTSMLLRVQPMLAPLMHPVSVRIHHWFVPFRLLWTGWEDFITGGPDGTGSALPFPTNTVNWTNNEGQLLDYLGLPTGKTYGPGEVNTMPVYAYNKIYNEYYRDQDIVTARALDDFSIPSIAWEKDYFTTARPWTQKGPAVTIPIGDRAPVKGIGKLTQVYGQGAANVYETDAAGTRAYTSSTSVDATTGDTAFRVENDPTNNGFPNIFADLSQATAADIVDFRRAFALQRYQEARAQYGSRYTEYLRYCGVTPSDARLQRPEYLGGGKQTISFSEVLQTATGGTGVGSLFGHGISALRSNRYRYFCEEHGFVMTLCSIRPKTMYVDGMEKMWSKRTKEEYYQKELELIGQQEILNRELFKSAAASTAADNNTFGYQDRYSEYRHERSKVSGEFRSTLDFWHLARKFSATPTLNSSFITCDPRKNIVAVPGSDALWMMASHSIQARRPVGNKTIGRIL